jgi:hypothetical protein
MRKFTAPIAMPTPKTIPANMRFESPPAKANIKPPQTNGHEAESSGYWAGKSSLQNVHGVFPGRSSGLGRDRQQEAASKYACQGQKAHEMASMKLIVFSH